MRLTALFLATVAWGQIDAPVIGHLLGRSGDLRSILGFAGNFIAGEPIAQDVVSAGFNFLKLDHAVKVLDARGREIATFEAPEGPALFSRTLIYYPRAGTLVRFSSDVVQPVFLASLDGEVVALNHDTLIVRREDGVLWKMRPSGELIDSLPDLPGPLLLLDDGRLLYADQEGIILDDRRIPLPDVQELTFLNDGWIHVRTPNHHYALKLATLHLFLLPEAAP